MYVFVPESGKCKDRALRRYVNPDGTRRCRCGCRACLKARGWALAWKEDRVPGFYGMPDITLFLPDYLYVGEPSEGEAEAARRHTWVGTEVRLEKPANIKHA